MKLLKYIPLVMGAAFLSSCALDDSSGSSNASSGSVAAYQAYNRPASLPSNPSAVTVKVS